MDEESRHLLAINTHKGLYEINTLPFRITPAPAIFQKLMKTVLGDLSGVTCYLEDNLVTGRTEDEHIKILKCLLQRVQDRGACIKNDFFFGCKVR